MDELVFSVSDFVAVLNQTLDYAYPDVAIVGEIANYRVSKNKWVYFDIKDEHASVRCFGTVYMLPGPLEDGLMVQVSGSPRLHQQFGFSMNMRTIKPVGEGAIKKASALLEKKLALEGLFDESRKRSLPYPPQRIGLITSSESAAYHDFLKILGSRWGGITVELFDVQVQGEAAPAQIIAALDYFNAQADLVDVIVVTRGGGSADDLATFSTEQVTRAVAGSRVPTLVAIGHEVDVSLAELAADRRASTPSNAAEVLSPDASQVIMRLKDIEAQLSELLDRQVKDRRLAIAQTTTTLNEALRRRYERAAVVLETRKKLLEVLSPQRILDSGFAVVQDEDGAIIRSSGSVKAGQHVTIRFADGTRRATIIEEETIWQK